MTTAALPLFPDFKDLDDDPGVVTGEIDAVLHTDIEKGFSIVRLRTAEDRMIVVSGRGDPMIRGDRVRAEGTWDTHPKYGRQFKARFIEASLQETAEGIERYLSQRHVAGVGPGIARRLRETFGDRLPEIMNMPSTLTAAGLTERKAQDLSRHWKMRTRHGRILSLFYAHKLGPAQSQRVIEHYGDRAPQIVKEDPYRLAREVRGIGFAIADRIALSQGRERTAPDRIEAGVRHAMSEAARDGHCAAEKSELISATSKLLVVEEKIVSRRVEAMILQGALVEERVAGRQALYDKAVLECENEVAALLMSHRSSIPLPGGIEKVIREVNERSGMLPLDDAQVEAVVRSLSSGVSVITGNPGTGKTSTLRVLLDTMNVLWPGIRIGEAAPTGRAAQRLAESTVRDAKTLHRMLEWSPESRGFTRNGDNPVECDVLIIDETSMLDIWITRDVLRALPDGARVVLVGDVDQLPSVGPGNVLGDIIESGIIPVSRLTKIHRQGDGSAIATASQQINAGSLPETVTPRRSKDMWGVYVKEPTDIRERLIVLMRQTIPMMGFDPLRDVQILAPGHTGDAGTAEINKLLQEVLNPPRADKVEVKHRNIVFRTGDRVIQIANDYDLEVYNGDIGNIVEIVVFGEDAGAIVVDFDGRRVSYEKADLDNLAHGFCISIHKSQGSEFPVVIVIATTQHYVMLKRNLIYTAVSRARRLCCVLGQQRALRIAVKSGAPRRLTGLAQRLASAGEGSSMLEDILSVNAAVPA